MPLKVRTYLKVLRIAMRSEFFLSILLDVRIRLRDLDSNQDTILQRDVSYH
jgi:hypothetical protein